MIHDVIQESDFVVFYFIKATIAKINRLITQILDELYSCI